jgi:hypothetical protein
MDLTRYWRTSHNSHAIEVQWTGMRLSGGWILRLLVDGVQQAESKGRSGKELLLQGQAGTEPFSVRFQQRPFQNRCIISAGDTVLQDANYAWNALAFLAIIGSVMLFTGVLILAFNSGLIDGGAQSRP